MLQEPSPQARLAGMQRRSGRDSFIRLSTRRPYNLTILPLGRGHPHTGLEEENAAALSVVVQGDLKQSGSQLLEEGFSRRQQSTVQWLKGNDYM